MWDRFDDAHDDVIKDSQEKESNIRELQGSLREAGILYDLFQQPASNNKSGPHEWYEESKREDAALERYEKYLRGLLSKGTSK